MTARMRLLLPWLVAGPVRRNVLLIAVDDLNTDLGCYGHAMVRSPHLDRLARRGVRFDRAYCQYPVSNPSRTSLLSGRYPEQTRVLDNRTNPREALPDAPFLPAYLRGRGMFTARVGKIYHDGMDSPADWDVSLDPRPARGGPGERGEGRNLTGGKFAFFRWLAAEGGDEDQADGLIAREAVRLLEQNRDKPFFLAVGFRKPHDPYAAPRPYFEPYPLDRVRGPEGPADDEADIPEAALPPGRHDLGPLEGREFRRAYYACTSFMDAQVGKVLAAVERLGLGADTLIVMFSDNGLHLGEHGWWNKVTLFERSARIPLILAGGPVAAAAGRTCRRTVELIDLYPTILEWTGIPAPPGLMGASLMRLARDPEAAWDKPAYTVVSRGPRLGRSLRTERFRYTEWDGGRLGVELYDHSSDPHEYRNLARDPAYARAIADLRARLRTRLKAAD